MFTLSATLCFPTPVLLFPSTTKSMDTHAHYTFAHMQAGALATLNTTTPSLTAIQRYTLGMPLPAAASDGTCSTTATVPVRFGANATVTCNVPLTQADLDTFCRWEGRGHPKGLCRGLQWPWGIRIQIVRKGAEKRCKTCNDTIA